MSWIDQLHFDERGLIPVVTQDAGTAEVLMLAFANRQALELTVSTGRAHYWSRSRGELWQKGATSGHTQEVVEVRADCDGDAVLFRVWQTGPACHTLERSCFHRRVAEGELARDPGAGHILDRLETLLRAREADRPEGSYTTYLFQKGVDKILKKLGEETTEVVIAAKNDRPDELRLEAADLIFHLLVLLRARDLPLEEVWRELESRFGRPPRPLPADGARSPQP